MKKATIIFPPSQPLRMRYEKKRLYGDLFRCGAGITIAAAVLFGLQALWWLNIVFAMIGVAFLLYLRQVLSRTARPLMVDASGVMLGRKQLGWDKLQKMKLRHFGGNNHSIVLGSSFFELTLIGDGAVIRCDSGISDFKSLLALLLQAMERYDIEIDDNSAHNLAYLTRDNSEK